MAPSKNESHPGEQSSGSFEVVASDLLAPGGMTPAAPRLYNLMHYGRSPGLAAMVLLMAGTAILCAGLGLGLWRLLAGIMRRHDS